MAELQLKRSGDKYKITVNGLLVNYFHWETKAGEPVIGSLYECVFWCMINAARYSPWSFKCDI